MLHGVDLGEFVSILGFQVALHIRHQLVQAGRQVGLLVAWVRSHYPVPQSCVYLPPHHSCQHPPGTREEIKSCLRACVNERHECSLGVVADAAMIHVSAVFASFTEGSLHMGPSPYR